MTDATSAAAPVTPETAALLTPPALAVIQAAGPDGYAALVVHGRGNDEGKRLLAALRPEHLLARPAGRADAASAVLAGLWLLHDWLDDSHANSQGLGSGTGSYWHAIMHRREGDFSNAKYWYARCRNHPAHVRVAALAEPILTGPTRADAALAKHAAGLTRGGWDPDGLVDLVEATYQRTANEPARRLVVALQRLEWQALFDESVRQATGGR